MSALFSGPPKPPKLPTSAQPQNPQLDAEAKANSQRQGAAASILTTRNANTAGSLFGS